MAARFLFSFALGAFYSFDLEPSTYKSDGSILDQIGVGFTLFGSIFGAAFATLPVRNTDGIPNIFTYIVPIFILLLFIFVTSLFINLSNYRIRIIDVKYLDLVVISLLLSMPLFFSLKLVYGIFDWFSRR